MRKVLVLGFVFIFSLGLSITYTMNLAHASSVGMVVDRVCTKQIDREKAETYKKDGHKYFFCSKKCKKTFKMNPEKYACICPGSSGGCPCLHCTGTGGLCDCAEITAYIDSHAGGHKHKQDEAEVEDNGGGHSH